MVVDPYGQPSPEAVRKWEAERAERRRQEEERKRREAERQAREDREELRQAAVDYVNEQVGPRYAPELVSLDTYQVKHKGQGETLARVKALAARLPESIQAGENLVLFGTVGTGKDHLAVSLLRLAAAEHAIPGEYWPGDRLEAHLAGKRDATTGELSDRVFREIRLGHASLTYPVALLSDPVRPASDLPAWILNKLFGVIDQRYRELKSTWLTVNVRSEEELKEKLSPQIFDRLSESCLFLPCFWPSFRQEQRQQRG
jgi:DNA replication protein DnaC